MPSKVFMICNSYESGFGHGLANDGLDLSKTPHADPEQGEAYQIGYDAGQEARKPKCTCNQGPHAGYCDLYAERPNVELTGAAPHGQQTKPQETEK